MIKRDGVQAAVLLDELENKLTREFADINDLNFQVKTKSIQGLFFEEEADIIEISGTPTHPTTGEKLEPQTVDTKDTWVIESGETAPEILAAVSEIARKFIQKFNVK